MTNIARQIYRKIVPDLVRIPLHRLRKRDELKRLRTTVFPSPKGDFSLKPFDEHECILVHITKTAGTSVATSLFGYLPYHYTVHEYRAIFGRRDFNRYFKFAFVRNPWDRLFSAFRYLKAGGWDEDDRLWAKRNLETYDHFEAFVMNWVTRDNIEKHVHFWPQCRFLCDRQNRVLVDFVGRFESLPHDFSYVANRLGIDAHLEARNVNPGARYQDIYTAEMKSVISSVYAEDIETFGYSFE